eukprot:g41459.t1
MGGMISKSVDDINIGWVMRRKVTGKYRQIRQKDILPDQHLLVLRRGGPGELLLPGPRIPYSKYRPYYLLREFTSAILTAVFIPPQVDGKNALDEIYVATYTLETKFPLFIVAGDFNQANPKRALPKYHHYFSCPTRGLNIIDHCCTTIKDDYCSIPHPCLGSHHSAVFLLPAYKHKLKREDPSQKEIQRWSEAAGEHLWDCLESVDWTVYKNSAENLDTYANTDTDFINKCVE